MASILSMVAAPGFCYSKSPMVGAATVTARPRRLVVVRAEGQGINPDIRKAEEKVVDSVVVTELSKPLTAYCRCWRSGTFPLCDGSHVKHNKATGDNVGPLLLKKHQEFLGATNTRVQTLDNFHLYDSLKTYWPQSCWILSCLLASPWRQEPLTVR